MQSSVAAEPDSSSHATPGREHPRSNSAHARGVLLIGLLKLGKSLLFFLIGVGALKLLHRDISDLLLQTALHLRFDTESRFVTLLLEKASLLNDHRLWQISLATFSYAVLALVEGIGLVLQKTWAEYFTLLLSVMFLPWETYELFHRFTLWKVGITVTNIAIVIYLLWILKEKRLKKERARDQNIQG